MIISQLYVGVCVEMYGGAGRRPFKFTLLVEE